MQLCHAHMALLFMPEARTPLGFFPGRRPILFACTTRPFDFCYTALPLSFPGPERKYYFKECTDCYAHEGNPQIPSIKEELKGTGRRISKSNQGTKQ